MKIQAVHVQNAFRPQLNPTHRIIDRAVRIDRVLKQQGLINGRGARLKRLKPFVIIVNGGYVLQSDWGRKLKDGDLIVTLPLPPHLQGGGGKSNPLKIILQIALIAAAIWVPGALGLAGWQAGAVGALTSVVGSMLINALLPEAVATSAEAVASAPSLLVGTQNNGARIRQPMPVLYGRRRFYPDLAAMPYNEMSDNSAYLYQLFCLTMGKMDVEQISIEKTPIANFDNVEYQIVEPYGSVTLFPDNVYTAPEVQDIELEGAVIGSGSDVIGYKKVVSFSMGGTTGVVTKTTSYTPTLGTLAFKTYTATPHGRETSRISVDFSFPGGLASVDSGGTVNSASVDFIVEYRKIDETGSPLGGWVRANSKSFEGSVEVVGSVGATEQKDVEVSDRITAASVDGQLRTINYAVPMGRYEVRIARSNVDSDKTSVSDSMRWIGLRSYMPSVKTYGNCTMLAVKIKATNNLNSNIARRVNVLGTRILPVFDGVTWADQPTRSPAWAAADVLRNTDYGRRFDDRRINIDELRRLSAVFNTRGDYCDGLFLDDTTIWEALSRVLEVGRTKQIYYAGMIDFVRNEKKLLSKSYMFTPNNMIKDSFNVRYEYPKHNDADYIIVEYTDPVSWSVKQVDCFLDDTQKTKPLTIQLSFCADRQQAWREGIHRAAINRVQREFPSFTTEMEGMLPRYGDKLLLSHDVPEWAASGWICYSTGAQISTSEELPWQDGANHVIALRARDGTVQGVYPCSKVDDQTALIAGFFELSKENEEPTHYIFGTSESVGLEAIMLSATPDVDQKVGVTCVTYSDYPHEAENSLSMPIDDIGDTEDDEVLAVAQLSVKKSIVDNVFSVSCNHVRDASKYQFQWSDDGGSNWSAAVESTSNTISTALPFGGAIKLRARAVGTFVDAWFTITTSVVAAAGVDHSPPSLLITSVGGGVNDSTKSFNIRIAANGDANIKSYQLELGDLVVWSGYLSPSQTASVDRVFYRYKNTTTNQYEDASEAVFSAYGVDQKGVLTAKSTQTVNY